MKIGRHGSAFILVVVGFLTNACSSSEGGKSVPVDSGTAGGGDAGTGIIGCTGKADGTDCSGIGGTGQICLTQLCFTSTCGDGFVDLAIGESCEDKNEAVGDGCTFCKFDCGKKEDCDDGAACNGPETCDVMHMCVAGASAPAATVCTLASGGAGECSQGVCARVGCGNGRPDAGEDCDDMNIDDSDGCTRDCKFTCAAAADCDDMNACNGAETCDMATTHKCVEGTIVSCTSQGCINPGACDPADGKCVFADADKDGSTCDIDCNDADPAIIPGGFECKDAKDNDCSAATADATAPPCECYVDADKDGFAGTITGSIVSGGACPDGYTRVKPVNAANTDCAVNTASAFPGQPAYFATGYCSGATRVCLMADLSFDYNCDGVETKSRPIASLATCASRNSVLACLAVSGWVGALGKAIPPCGGTGTYRACSWNKLAGGCVGKDTPNEIQACR